MFWKRDDYEGRREKKDLYRSASRTDTASDADSSALSPKADLQRAQEEGASHVPAMPVAGSDGPNSSDYAPSADSTPEEAREGVSGLWFWVAIFVGVYWWTGSSVAYWIWSLIASSQKDGDAMIADYPQGGLDFIINLCLLIWATTAGRSRQ